MQIVRILIIDRIAFIEGLKCIATQPSASLSSARWEI